MGNGGLQIAAGVISSLLFASSNFPMLIKAYKTKDMQSYSLGYLAIGNIGNLFHWVYVSNLPFGPIWFLHGFFTLVSILMLIWYLRYEHVDVFAALSKRPNWLWGKAQLSDRPFAAPNRVQVWHICSGSLPCLCTRLG